MFSFPVLQELHKDKKKTEKDWEDDEAVRVKPRAVCCPQLLYCPHQTPIHWWLFGVKEGSVED
jgi:hypothetical protein